MSDNIVKTPSLGSRRKLNTGILNVKDYKEIEFGDGLLVEFYEIPQPSIHELKLPTKSHMIMRVSVSGGGGDGNLDILVGDILQIIPKGDCLYLGSFVTNEDGSIKRFYKDGWNYSWTEPNIQTSVSGVSGSYADPFYWSPVYWPPTATELKFSVDMSTDESDSMKLYQIGNIPDRIVREIKWSGGDYSFPMTVPGIYFIHNASHVTVSGILMEADHLSIYHTGFKE